MTRKCFVTGASSQIGTWLIPELLALGWLCTCFSRGQREQFDYGTKAAWHKFDLSSRNSVLPQFEADVLFHTAAISALTPWLQAFADHGVNRVIAFSSTSIFTKTESNDPHDLAWVNELKVGEEQMIAECERLGIAWTIFRPTLIYGGKLGDRNVSDIARLIKKLNFFPMFGKGNGLRQPVHAADLAKACIQACDENAAFNRAYILSGAETLSYTQMVKRIFLALDRKPRFIRTPIWVFEVAVSIAKLHPRYAHLTSSMARRMQQDMNFSYEEAKAAFGYSPRSFDPDFLKSELI